MESLRRRVWSGLDACKREMGRILTHSHRSALLAWLCVLPPQWSEGDVGRFISSKDLCNLPQYADAFKEAGIDGEMLLELTDEELTDLGVANKFHRKKILKKLSHFRQ